MGVEIDENIDDACDSTLKLWLFPKPNAQRGVVISDFVLVELREAKLGKTDNLFNGHGRLVFDKHVDRRSADGFNELIYDSGKVLTTGQLQEKYGAHKQLLDQKKGFQAGHGWGVVH